MAKATPVTIAGNLPADSEHNGLEPIREDLIADDVQLRYAVVLFDVKSTKKETDTGERTPTVRIRHIEPAFAADAEEVRKLLTRLSEDRLGALPLSSATDGDEPDPDIEDEPAA